ncbi:Dynamin family GTPase [uncultured virus]|nr:Dynamin family GTPase [uncultured virus]
MLNTYKYSRFFGKNILCDLKSKKNFSTRQKTINQKEQSNLNEIKKNYKEQFQSNEIKKNYKDTSQLFIAISDLSRLGLELKSFPGCAVFGPQSVGKTSVLEAICDIQDFLPKGEGMVTKKPIHVTMIKSQNILYKIGDKEIKNESDAREEINHLNYNDSIKKIDVRIHSPNVCNSSLIDLPGLFVVSDKNDPDLPNKVKKMNMEYISNEKIIPIVITSAAMDPATNQALKMLGRFQREKDSLGIITKIDLMEKQNMIETEQMLSGKKYPLGHGYVTVILRNKEDIDKKISMKDKILMEKEYFSSRPNLHPSGVPEMRQIISNIQFEKLKDQIPFLISDIEKEILNLEQSITFLETIVNDPQNQLIKRLRTMIESLVFSSPDRAVFEQDLKKEMDKSIDSNLEKIFNSSNKNFTEVYSNQKIDGNIFAFHSSKRTDPMKYKIDKFKRLFSFGLISPVVVNNDTIDKYFENEIELAGLMSNLKFTVDDPLGKKKLQWNRYLNSYFDDLLTHNKIQTMVFEITEKKLIEFICSKKQDPLTSKFASYMIKEISDEAFTSKIKFSIDAMINTERRPNVCATELTRHLVQLFPNHFKFKGGFDDYFLKNKHRLKIEVYSEAWNIAFLRVISDKMKTNCFGNVAVILLDQMIDELLKMTINMFRQDFAKKKQSTVSDKIKKLNELKTILKQYV